MNYYFKKKKVRNQDKYLLSMYNKLSLNTGDLVTFQFSGKVVNTVVYRVPVSAGHHCQYCLWKDQYDHGCRAKGPDGWSLCNSVTDYAFSSVCPGAAFAPSSTVMEEL